MYESTLIATREEIEQIINKQIQTPNDTPRVWIACLSAYNNGYLHGKWVDCTLGYDNLEEEIQSILKSSPEPGDEWAIHDYQNFYGIDINEWHDLAHLCELATALDESGNGEMFASVYNHLGTKDIESVKEFIDDNYTGTYKDLEDYAYELCEECGEIDSIPKHLQGYIDYPAMGRDMEYNGDIFTIDCANGIHVFWSH